jgi:large subunit ribosomal protein L25
MSEYKLAAEPRQDKGKGPARRARAAGRVPAVLYGHGMDPQHLTVDARDFRFAMRTDAGSNVLLSLKVGSQTHLTLAKDVQRHPIRGDYIHIDFLSVRRGEKVTVSVPVHLVGEAPGVRDGGVADQDIYQINLEAEVTAVPEQVEVDISGLQIGDVLRVGDITAPSGATIVDDPEASVISVVAPTVETAPAEAPEGAEAEAATETPAEGEGPSTEGAEGDAAKDE